MDQTTLVKRLEAEGERLAALLRDDENFGLSACFWWWDSDASAWILVVASQFYVDNGPKATYERIHRWVKKLSSKRSSALLSIRSVSAIASKDPRVAAMASAIGVSGGSVRVSASNLNGIEVKDALIYELSSAGAAQELETRLSASG